MLLLISCTGFGQTDHYLAGRAYMNGSLFDSARFHLEAAVQENPGDAQLYYQLGLACFSMQDFPAAHEAFYEAEKRRKGMASFYLAKCEVRLNHPQQALKYLRDHLSSRYKKTEAEILLDEELSTLDQEAGWQALWEERKWFSAKDASFQEALFMKDHGQYLDAINLLNKLEKQGYKRSLVQSETALIYLELGNNKAASSSLKSAVKSDGRNLDAAVQLATLQLADGDAEEAATGLNHVIRQDPALFEAYIQRASARSISGDLAGAMEDIDLYLSYFPDKDSVIYLKGLIQFQHGKYLDAIQSFNRSLAMNSGASAYYFARGRTYAATGTTRYAAKDMSMALDLDPLNGEIWIEKGRLDLEMGMKKSACHCFGKAYQYGIFEAGELIDQNCK